MKTERFDNGGFITDSNDPTLYKVRFFPEESGDTLTIYDNQIGAERGTEIAHLDKDNPNIDFGINGQRCFNGLFALLEGGSFYATWQD